MNSKNELTFQFVRPYVQRDSRQL